MLISLSGVVSACQCFVRAILGRISSASPCACGQAHALFCFVLSQGMYFLEALVLTVSS